MRTEQAHGRWLLCGSILRDDQVKPGQIWASAAGDDRIVRVAAVAHGWVTYTWEEDSQTQYNDKSIFAFQCRYCLVLDGPEIPKELL